MNNGFNLFGNTKDDLKIVIKKKVKIVKVKRRKEDEKNEDQKKPKQSDPHINRYQISKKRKRTHKDPIGRLLRSSSDENENLSNILSPDPIPEWSAMPPRNLLVSESNSEILSFTHSADVVNKCAASYKDYFTDGCQTINIAYPLDNSMESYILKASKDESDYMPILEAIETMRLLVTYMIPKEKKMIFGDISTEGILRDIVKFKNRKQLSGFINAVNRFNETFIPLRPFMDTRIRELSYIPSDLSTHILSQVYNRTVGPQVELLSKYRAFSNNVYGELRESFISRLLRQTQLGPNNVFVDLGSGVGNCVLQAAIETGAESYGAEVMDTTANMALDQAKEFISRMKLYRLQHGKVHMIHGDFLQSSEIVQALKKADVVLCNNYAFHSDLNNKLIDLFLDLKDGTKIISLKSFLPPDYHISERNLDSPQSILRVKQYQYYSGSVSWTNTGGQYFIATVDRSRIQSYINRKSKSLKFESE